MQQQSTRTTCASAVVKVDKCNTSIYSCCGVYANDAYNWTRQQVCDSVCGFEFDTATQKCWIAGTGPTIGKSDGTAAPIIGGSGKFRSVVNL